MTFTDFLLVNEMWTDAWEKNVINSQTPRFP